MGKSKKKKTADAFSTQHQIGKIFEESKEDKIKSKNWFRYDEEGNLWEVKAQSGDMRVYRNGQQSGEKDWQFKGISNSSKEKAVRLAESEIDKANARVQASPSKSPKATIEKAQEDTQEAYGMLAEKLSENRDEAQLLKMLTDEVHAEVNEQNLANPNDPITGFSKIMDWRDNYDNISPKAKNMLEKYFGEGESKKLPDKFFNNLVWNFESQKNKYNLMDALSNAKEERHNIIDELKDSVDHSEKDRATLGHMLSDGSPYKDVWDRVPEQFADRTPTPQELQRIKSMQDLNRAQASSFSQGDVLSQSMPQKPLPLDWDNQPTIARAITLNDELFGDNYSYDSAKPFDQRLNRLGRAGHGAGSSSIENTEGAKQRAMHQEKLQNIAAMHNMLLNENRARGDTIGQANQLAAGSRDAYQEPIGMENKVMGDSFDRERRDRYNENISNKDIAQGEMALSDQDLQQDAMLFDILEKDRANKLAQSETAQNLINQYDMLIQSNNIEAAKTSADYANLRENLWMNREKLVLAMRQKNMAEEAKRLDQAKSKDEFITQLLGLGVRGAGIVASVFAGNPSPSGIAEAVAQKLENKNFKGFGGSAGAGTPYTAPNSGPNPTFYNRRLPPITNEGATY